MDDYSRLISKHIVKYQFGSTPRVRCQDGTFTIKKILHLRHNHNLPTWVAFVDLVKDFNTSNHELLITILGKYGASPILCSAIKRMYEKSVVKLIIVKIETSIDSKLGVKQGDSMAPVLFMFLMMAFAETLEEKWTALGLRKSQFAHKDNTSRYTGQLVSHQPGTFSSSTLFNLFCMLYVDDGIFFC